MAPRFVIARRPTADVAPCARSARKCPWGAISGRQLRFRRGFPVIPPGTARLPRPPWGLAMTRQEGARCTSTLLRLNHPRTRRSGSAATGWLWVPAILMAARSKRRCGPAKDESYIFSRFLLLSRQPEVKAIRRKPDIDANHVLFTFYMIA